MGEEGKEGGAWKVKFADGKTECITADKMRFLESDGKKGKQRIHALEYFMDHAGVKTAHKEVVGKHLMSTWQRRCCGEQGEKIKTKTNPLSDHAKDIDHSFYRGFKPLAAMTLPKDKNGKTEVELRWGKGGLPAAGNSSDHIYLCVEYQFGGDIKPTTKYPQMIILPKKKEQKKEKKPKENVPQAAPKPKSTKTPEDEGMLTKFKNFFYDEDNKKLDWKNWKKVVPTVGLGLGAVAAVAGAGVKMGVLGQEEKGMSGMAKAGIAAAALAGVGAAAYGYKKYKAGQDDSEVDDADREVSLGESKKNKKNRKSKGKKDQDEKGSSKMLLIFGGLAVLAVVAFLVFGKAEKKSATPLEGDELV